MTGAHCTECAGLCAVFCVQWQMGRPSMTVVASGKSDAAQVAEEWLELMNHSPPIDAPAILDSPLYKSPEVRGLRNDHT